jgi:hypothetical protein
MKVMVLLIQFGFIFLILPSCATTRYQPLAEAPAAQITRLKEDTFRVEYRVSPFTSQEALDAYLLRRCAEVTIREGYDYFAVGEKHVVLSHHRITSVTAKMFKGEKPKNAPSFYNAKDVLEIPPS